MSKVQHEKGEYLFDKQTPNLILLKKPTGQMDSILVEGMGNVMSAEPSGVHHILINKGLPEEAYFHTLTHTLVPKNEYAEVRSGFAGLDIFVFIVYFIVQIGIGFWFYRKQKDGSQFFKGSGKLPMWAIGFSIFATALSAITFMAIPAKAFDSDWSFSLINLGPILIAPLIAGLFIPTFRRLNITSGYQYIEKRFNAFVSVFCSVSFILFHIGRIGIVLLLPSIALNVVTGMDIFLCISLMGVLSLLYTIAGGMEAVVWTDVIQVFVLLGGALLSIGFMISDIPGGFSQVIASAKEFDKLSLGSLDFDVTSGTIWTLVIGSVFTNLITYGSDQTMIQRYVSTATEFEAKKSMWLNAWMVLPATVIFFAIGTCLFVFYQTNPQLLNPTMTDKDSIFPWYIFTSLPAGISGLVIAGIFAAAMSTLSSSMGSSATTYCLDIHPRIFKGGIKNELKLARIMTFTLGALGILFAYYMATVSVSSIWDEFNKILGVILGSMGGVFLLGLIVKKANATGANTGIISSILVQLMVSTMTSLHFMLYSATGVLTCFLIGWMVSLIFPSKQRVSQL